mmetsp:Transcript_10747/g.37323  ORF Transcript_10747/g.37323 Transcript_10747/m.37323 type:complete len:247 (-) Transcript_10747:651-1391(-)
MGAPRVLPPLGQVLPQTSRHPRATAAAGSVSLGARQRSRMRSSKRRTQGSCRSPSLRPLRWPRPRHAVPRWIGTWQATATAPAAAGHRRAAARSRDPRAVVLRALHGASATARSPSASSCTASALQLASTVTTATACSAATRRRTRSRCRRRARTLSRATRWPSSPRSWACRRRHKMCWYLAMARRLRATSAVATARSPPASRSTASAFRRASSAPTPANAKAARTRGTAVIAALRLCVRTSWWQR